MTTPNWLSDAEHNPGDYSEAIAADVAGVLTTLKSKLVTNGNWTLTSEVAGTNLRVKSPVKPSSGQYLDILIAKIDADTLDFTVADMTATTVRQGRIDIAAAGNTTVDYFWGDDYLIVASRRVTPEIMQAYILDPSAVGALDADQANRVLAQMYRDTAGATSATRLIFGFLYGLHAGVSTILERNQLISGSNGITAGRLLGLGTRMLSLPALCYIPQGGNNQWSGALPMMVLVDSGISAVDDVIQIPVDNGTTRAFKATALTINDLLRPLVRYPSGD